MLNSNDVIWKALPGYEGRYEVSNQGVLRSIRTNHGTYQEKVISSRTRSVTCQYLYAQMSVNGAAIHIAIHRAVAAAFIPNPESKPMVNHIDGNKLNNNACNLEWVTCRENHLHAFATNLRDNSHIVELHLGSNSGCTSKYHNVTWDKSRGKWKATLKDQGKMLFQKRFDNEEDAALFVNNKLDELGFTNRPKNVIT